MGFIGFGLFQGQPTPPTSLSVPAQTPPTATSGVPYDYAIDIQGNTGLTISFDISDDSPSPNKDSPRWIGVLPALGRLKGEAI